MLRNGEQRRPAAARILSMDRMTAMAVFVQVVETASFSEAARRLGLSKSSVSVHVAQVVQKKSVPPSTGMVAPTVKAVRGEHSSTASAATSSGRPMRPMSFPDP